MPWSRAQLRDVRLEERADGRRVRCFADRPTDGLWAMLDRAAQARPSDGALIFGDQRVSYAEFAATVERAAAGLRSVCDVQQGTRVALLLGNSLEFAYAFYACQRLGAIVVPLNTRLQGAELAYMLTHAGAQVLIGDPAFLGRLDAVHLPELRHRFAVGQGWDGYRAWAELMATDVPAPPPIAVCEDDPACILYTSGTTGLPKGAVLTHFSLAHTLMHYARAMALRPDERSLVAVPLFHITALGGQLALMVYLGGCTVIMPEFKVERFLEAMDRYRCTHTIVVPTIYVLCLMSPSIRDVHLPHWRVAAYGGAPMAEATVVALAQRFPDLRLHNVYGATETSGPTTISPAEGTLGHPASVGLPVMCAELRVVDEHGRDVDGGQAGELWIKGPTVVPGYWDNPEANRVSFADGGYWRSGDVARIDADGYVYIMDRKKDMISRGGFKIYSVEVENVLYQHPDVLEAAVVGVPDPVLGERVKAVVVPRADRPADPADIRSFCAERLGDYKVPEIVEVRDVLPRNPGGKVLKALLKEPRP